MRAVRGPSGDCSIRWSYVRLVGSCIKMETNGGERERIKVKGFSGTKNCLENLRGMQRNCFGCLT